MSERFRVRRFGRAFIGAATLVALACLTVAVSAQGSLSRAASAKNVYLVQLTGEPAVTYEGDIAGLPATKPAKGEKIDPEAAHVKRFVAHLNARHDSVLEQVGGANKLYNYNYVINGFAAELTAAQVAQLEKNPEVVSIEEAEEYWPDTSVTPAFLGLTGAQGLWAQLGGPQSGTNSANATGAGEGVVVGIIDTGIWPEHPSVSDRVGGRLMYKPLPGNRWKGKCASPGNADPTLNVVDGSWTGNLCNQKLVGARFFLETREAVLGPVVAPDFRSPRDFDGHGTHTGTTAAGNHGIMPTGDAAGLGAISGMAPRARIAAYKVCWPSCFTPDSAAAYDQAVADGVDVLNFSISGSTSALTGFVPDATRRAAEAGVFVAMSAGNSGPGDSTVAHVMPWVTTVAAGTHDRPQVGTVTLGDDGPSFEGNSLITGPLTAEIIRSQDAGLDGANANLVRQCFSSLTAGSPQLDPAKVAGKIVVCERGGAAPANARIDKSFAVREAGGVGMVQINVAATASLNGDLHFLPSVHLPSSALAPVQAHAQTPGATATLDTTGEAAPAPIVAAFSSRGPQAGAQQNLLKPDVIAPGVDILAGYSPVAFGRLFDVISGTSMSSPHVAGLAALLKHRHPSWTPMMIKSALMTTGSDIVDPSFPDTATASSEARRTFAQGAGHARPTLAADPGLVIEHTPADWPRYICGAGQAACSNPLHPTDLNGPSISIGAMPGARTVERTVRSVASETRTYSASFSGLPGIDATIAPAGMITIEAGASQTLTLTFTNQSAPLNKWQSGHLTLTPTAGGNAVRIPIVIRPVAIAAPASVSLGADNNAAWTIQSGISGTITLSKTGLQAATTDTETIEDDPGNSFTPGGPGTWSKTIAVPNNTLVRFELFDEDTDGNDDLDLYLFRGATLVSSSGSPTSREIVQHRNTAGAANYTIWVHAWQTDGPDAEFTLFGWTLNADELGTLAPTSIATTPGEVHDVTLTTSGLTPGVRYLGEAEYRQGTTLLARTLLTGKAQ